MKVTTSICSDARSEGKGSSNSRETATIGAAWTPALRRFLSRSAKATGDGRGTLAGVDAGGVAVGLLLPSGAAGGVVGRLGSRGGRLWPYTMPEGPMAR